MVNYWTEYIFFPHNHDYTFYCKGLNVNLKYPALRAFGPGVFSRCYVVIVVHYWLPLKMALDERRA